MSEPSAQPAANRVLVALDPSPFGLAALEAAIQWAAELQAELQGLFVEDVNLVRACHAQGKLITAICHGPWILISAGLARGKQITGYVAVRDDLVNAGATWVDVPAIRDGNIISGRVPTDLPEFCHMIIDALAE